MSILFHRLATVVVCGILGGIAVTAHAADDDKPAKKPLPAGDVVVSRSVRADAGDIYTWLLDLDHHRQVWPEGCTTKWEYGTTTAGIGANARLTYRVAMMRRRLTATVSEGDPGRYLKVDHAGRTGFATTWTLNDLGSGQTRVEVHTWVDPPPWPLTATYMNRIRPAWTECHRGLLDNLAREMTGSAP